jgi:hypothetical protein
MCVPPLLRSNRCPDLHPPMPFAVVVPSFFRSRGHLPPGSFIRLLPSSLVALCHCCLSGTSTVSSCPFVFSGFLLQHHLGLSLMLVSLTLCYFCTAGHPYSGGAQFLPRPTISLGPNIPGNVSLAPCQCCTAGHLPAGGSQLPPGSTISSGQFVWLSATPAARYRPLCRFFRPPTGFTTASRVHVMFVTGLLRNIACLQGRYHATNSVEVALIN